jgi:hypothetical protein
MRGPIMALLVTDVRRLWLLVWQVVGGGDSCRQKYAKVNSNRNEARSGD